MSEVVRRWNAGVLALLAASGLALAVVPDGRADDAFWSGSIGGTGPGYTVDLTHQDAYPWKGSVSIQVLNSGAAPWGDFHFEIYDPIGGQNISNVHFLDASMGGIDPTSSQSPLTWVINNVVVGATIDLYYYSDPVYPGQTATFSVYTDNPDHVSFFGVKLFPTPIPEPASLTLLGLAGLLLRRQLR